MARQSHVIHLRPGENEYGSKSACTAQRCTARDSTCYWRAPSFIKYLCIPSMGSRDVSFLSHLTLCMALLNFFFPLMTLLVYCGSVSDDGADVEPLFSVIKFHQPCSGRHTHPILPHLRTWSVEIALQHMTCVKCIFVITASLGSYQDESERTSLHSISHVRSTTDVSGTIMPATVCTNTSN